MKKKADNTGEAEPLAPGISMGPISIDVKDFNKEPDMSDLPVLPTRNLMLFPGVHLSIGLGREMSRKVAEYSESTHNPVAIVCQLHPQMETPAMEDLYECGVVADIFKVLEMPDGSVNALVRARSHFAITGPGSGKAVPGAISVTGKILPEIMPEADDKEFEAMIDNIRTLARKTSKKDPDMPGILNFDDNSSAEDVVNVTATNIPLPLDRKQTMLMLTELKARAEMLMTALEQYEQMLDVRRDVMERARHGMEENQRNAFLQMQMDTIRD